MASKTAANKILGSYNSKVAWGDADHEQALIESINFAFPFRAEEERAELFAMLSEEWDKYQAGIPRQIFVASVIQRWNHRSIFSRPAKRTEGVQGKGNPKQKESKDAQAE